MSKRNIITLLVLVISSIVLSSGKSEIPPIDDPISTTTDDPNEKPYLILISLDGFRWDYVERFKPPNLTNFIKNGVSAESLIPSFPSKTFPNHYTIATGMYPDKHGLLGNSFYSYKKDVTYSINNRQMVEDGSFYGGSPIWVQASKANVVSASYFFVGTEADIQGIHPNYYKKYDGSIKNEERIDQAIKWLEMPDNDRPHLITMYFSDLDDVGHKFGPENNDELKSALLNLDRNLGNLFKRTAMTGLPINIIIVSDHGMTTVPTSNLLAIDDLKNEDLFTTIDNGAIINIHPNNGVSTDSVLQYLKPKENHFKVYKTENTPGFEYIPTNKNWGSVQVIPDFEYYFYSDKRIKDLKKNDIKMVGVHGYDPKYKDMHGIFYANGPAFKQGYQTPSVKNIHVYPIMCKILGLDIPDDIDGKLEQLEGVLNND